MSYKIWLDDERDPPKLNAEAWVWCKNAKQFVDTIKTRGMPDHIEFDWWLGSGWPTGQDMIAWLIDQDQQGVYTIPKNFTYGVHSSDDSKNRIMLTMFDRYLESKGHI